MYITDVSNQWVLTLPPPAPGTPDRSPGLHVSDLVRAAAIDAGLFEADDVNAELPHGQSFSQMSVNRMVAGVAWENWLATQYAGRVVFHPGEVDVMGVKGSPDGISIPGGTTNDVHVHEFKFTWKSTNTPMRKCWYWVSQIQAYLYGMGCTGAYLHTFHVMGDYKGSGPIYRVLHMRFTQVELVANWQTLEQYRRTAKEI